MRLAVIALTAVVFAAGCGAAESDAPDLSGPEQQVADVIEDLQSAADEKAPRRVCTDLLSRELAQQLGDGCIRAMEQAFDDADTSQLGVEDVRVSGSTARVRITTGTGDEDEELVELAREGEAWRITRFAGPAPTDG